MNKINKKNSILSTIPIVNRTPIMGIERALIIPYVIEIVKQENDNIISNGSGFFLYNGCYWESVTEIEMGIFLKTFALSIGCPEKIARPHKEVDSLIKQAYLDLYQNFSTNKNVLNFTNGTLELDTLKFREHRKEDYLLYSLPYAYDKNAVCPKWKKFLSEVLPEEDLQRLLQEAVGYPLSKLHLEKLIFLYGDGLNGKSVVLETIQNVLGRENTTTFSLDQITNKDGLCIAQMIGKLVNISFEGSQNIYNTPILKSYISGERLPARYQYGNPFITDDYPQSIIASNNMPHITEHTLGVNRRFLTIPFNVTIAKDKINPNLTKELCEELPGICNWLIEGIKRLKENNKFSESEAANRLLEEFKTENDYVYFFVEELGYKPSENKILLSTLHKEFEIWSKTNGHNKMSIRTFSKRLKHLDFKVKKSTGNATYVWIEKETANSSISDNDLEYDSLLPF